MYMWTIYRGKQPKLFWLSCNFYASQLHVLIIMSNGVYEARNPNPGWYFLPSRSKNGLLPLNMMPEKGLKLVGRCTQFRQSVNHGQCSDGACCVPYCPEPAPTGTHSSEKSHRCLPGGSAGIAKLLVWKFPPLASRTTCHEAITHL